MRYKQKTLLFALLIIAFSNIAPPGFILSLGTVQSQPDVASRSAPPNWSPVSFAMQAVPGQASLLGTVDVATLSSPGTSSQPYATPFLSPQLSQVSEVPAPHSASPAGITGSSVAQYSGFDGLNQAQSGNYFPPDVQVATGPNHVMEMANLAGEIFSKQGVSLSTLPLSQFFNTTHSLSDPEVLFDAPTGRWFASIIDLSVDNVTVAVSTTGDPTGAWKLYGVSAGSFLPDQPIIGVNDDKFVISANDFGSFVGAQIWVLNKGQMVAGAARIDLTTFGPDAPYFSVHPVHSLSPTPILYLVSVGSDLITPFVSTVQLFSVDGVPPGTVTLRVASIPISTVSDHVNGVQLGTDVFINTDDTRVQTAVWFQGKLWFGFNEGCTPPGDTAIRSCFRLTQINTSNLSVSQEFDFCEAGRYCFYPALRVDAQGNLAVIYGFSSPTEYPSLAITGQEVTDSANSLRQPLVIATGSAPETAIGFPGRPRYGDYFGAGVDPSDQTLIWVAGEYHNNATGNCGSDNCWSTFIASMRVEGTGYTISTSPTYVTVTPGSFGTSTITVTSIGGFEGVVSLSASVSPSGPSVSMDPASVSLVAGSSATSTLTMSTTSSTPGGTYTVTVTGTSGSFSIPGNVFAFVVGFGITANPNSFSDAAGTTSTSALTVTSFHGFTGTVGLSATVSPSGPTLSLSPSSISLTPGGLGTSTLTISTTTSTAHGIYTVTLNATSGTLSQTVPIPRAVTTFTVNINNVTTFTGVKVTTSGSLSVDAPSNSLTVSGSVTVSAKNATTNKSISSTTYTISKLPLESRSGGSYETLFLFKIAVNPYPLSSNNIISISGTTGTSTVFVSRNLDINGNGIVDMPDINAIAAAYGCSQGQACYNPQADLNANGIVDIFDASMVARFFGRTVIIPDFTISASPTSLTISAGSSSTSTISVTSTSAFTGTVSLTVSASPSSGISTSLNPTSLTLRADRTSTSTLTVSSSTPGFYTLTVTGTSGLLTQSASVTVSVLDFGLTSSKTLLSEKNGYGAQIRMASLNGFSGTVTLSFTVTPKTGLTVTLNPTSVPVAAWGTGTSSLSVTPSCPLGQICSWTIIITGASGSLSHSVQIDVTRCRRTFCPESPVIEADNRVLSLITTTRLEPLDERDSSFTPTTWLADRPTV